MLLPADLSLVLLVQVQHRQSTGFDAFNLLDHDPKPIILSLSGVAGQLPMV